MPAKSIIFILLLIFVGNTFAADSNAQFVLNKKEDLGHWVLDLEKDLAKLDSLDARIARTEAFRKLLTSRELELAPFVKAVREQFDAANPNDRISEESAERYLAVNEIYFRYLSLQNFISLIAPFNGEKIRSNSRCSNLLHDVNYSVADVETTERHGDPLRDIRQQALRIGRLIHANCK